MTSNYNLEISFDDNEEGIYYPGQTVKGQLRFTVSTAMKIRGLVLTIKGSAMCNYSKDLNAEQEFFVQERDLFGSKGADPSEIPAGTYNYDFAHRLPRNIPYSSEGTFGYVKYFVSGTLDLPWDMYDKNFTKTFTVNRYEDLNYMSGMRDPRELITKKEIDSPSWIFWKAATGYIIIKGNIPKCGYASEEKVNVDLEINNQSSIDIENISISLQNTNNFVCQTPWAKLEKNTQNKLSEVIAQPVKAGYTAKIKEQILIPAGTALTSVMYCNVFQITYNIQIALKFRKWNSPVTVLNIPIYIGSVGLKPADQLDKNVRIPPLWPPGAHVEKSDIENAERENAENVDAALDVNDNTTEEATD